MALGQTRVGAVVVVEGPAGAALLRDAGDINDVIGECFAAHTTLALRLARCGVSVAEVR